MESYSCNLALGGNIGMVVRKEGLSVAEMIVLRHIHGDSSVIDIEEYGLLSAKRFVFSHFHPSGFLARCERKARLGAS